MKLIVEIETPTYNGDPIGFGEWSSDGYKDVTKKNAKSLPPGTIITVDDSYLKRDPDDDNYYLFKLVEVKE
jgi:hypothetical protein